MITNLSSVHDPFVKVLMIFIDADTMECVGTTLISMSISYCRGINMISCPRIGYHIYHPVISPSYHGNGRQILVITQLRRR